MDLRQLIKECGNGSSAAQQLLFNAMADSMMVVCCRYIKNQQDSEEVLLDGFYKFFKNLDSFQYHNDAALYGWIKRIMVNECLMFLRKKNVFTISIESETEQVPVAEEALDNLTAGEIFNMIIQLPVGYRTVFNLYAIEGMSHGEIASQLGIMEGTSKSQLSKARQLLQKLLIQKNEEYANRKAR